MVVLQDTKIIMNKQYLINVWKNKQFWCRIELDCPWVNEVIEDIQLNFSTEKGYFLELLVATDESRIIESKSSGVHLLARKIIYGPAEYQDQLISK